MNVDSFALDEALSLDPIAQKIKVFLFVTFERCTVHY